MHQRGALDGLSRALFSEGGNYSSLIHFCIKFGLELILRTDREPTNVQFGRLVAILQNLSYFTPQVADLARLNHENTGKLLGYCRESSPFTRMLVFEYASNGTLYEHLHCKLSFFSVTAVCINVLQ